MEQSLSINPVEYMPKYNSETKEYEEQYIYDFTHGLCCPCTGNVFHKRSAFTAHMKTQRHKKWISSINTNTINYYQKHLENEKTIKNQQIRIIQLENELRQKAIIIQYLESNITNRQNSFNQAEYLSDLLDFD